MDTMIKERVGKATWFDLPTMDATDAMAFYEGLLGWKFLRMKDPVLADYWLIQKGDELIGGLRETVRDNVSKFDADAPVVYFTVENLEASVTRARELGAKLVGERVDLGEGRGSFQWLRDRQNNLVALWAPE